ncbi:hypothetical protein SAMN05421630_102369 [Prauserella marina]|uniref:Uncharacterized protein n=1 Tax=Prauserella marina TaxID=530584 RepID=A0A1G6M7S6_9PSEU|nr:hypothetical protein [Prauserella marina]SDC50995.1 hypothetical protein SAMN05421630_102369 [Prauserella marina]
MGTELAVLSAELDDLSTELDSLSAELDSLSAELADLSAELDGLSWGLAYGHRAGTHGHAGSGDHQLDGLDPEIGREHDGQPA